jgi:hypothetical protein
VTIGSYVVGAATQVTVIGLSLANTTVSDVTVSVALNDGTNNTSLIKDGPVPSGGALVLMGGDQKLVMQTGDSIVVTSSAATSIDAVLSILEIT